MTETWIKWEPLRLIPEKLFLERLVDGKEGLSIEFSDESEAVKLTILFDGVVLSHRNTGEGSRISTLHFLQEKYGNNFYSKWMLFKVENSEYVKWFEGESCGMYDSYPIQHFVFLTANDILEVLATFEPNVKLENE